jgi:hypothetical protein
MCERSRQKETEQRTKESLWHDDDLVEGGVGTRYPHEILPFCDVSGTHVSFRWNAVSFGVCSFKGLLRSNMSPLMFHSCWIYLKACSENEQT